jgi:histidinol-phosphate aminotransferase
VNLPPLLLDCNESPLPPDEREMSLFARELSRLALNRYPEVSGRPLREALAARWSVVPEAILLGNGSEELISLLCSAYGRNDDGSPVRVLYPDPTFNQYEALAKIHGAKPLPIPLEPDFSLNEARFADAIDRARPALSFFASPNNPTGNRFDPDVLERLARRAGTPFVIDEAYVEFSGNSAIPRICDTPSLLVLRSFSKIGFAGLRLGALVGDPATIRELDKVRLPWNVNAVSLALGCTLIRHPEGWNNRIRDTVARRHELGRALSRLPGVVVYPSDTNFLLVRFVVSAKALFEELWSRGVRVKNVSAPGSLENCLRISVGTGAENRRLVRELARAIERHAAPLDATPSRARRHPRRTGS